MQAWTDCPIEELGDAPGETAPIREVRVIGSDGDKYSTVEVEGITTEIKSGYVYPEPRRAQ